MRSNSLLHTTKFHAIQLIKFHGTHPSRLPPHALPTRRSEYLRQPIAKDTLQVSPSDRRVLIFPTWTHTTLSILFTRATQKIVLKKINVRLFLKT